MKLERIREAIDFWEKALSHSPDEKLTHAINEKLNTLYQDLPAEALKPGEESYRTRLHDKLNQALLPDEIILE